MLKVFVLTYEGKYGPSRIKIFSNEISAFEWAREFFMKEWGEHLSYDLFCNSDVISGKWFKVEW